MRQPGDPLDERDDAFARLLSAARKGETWAWERIYGAFSPFVVGYLRSQRIPDADDLAGEVFVQVVRTIAGFEGDATRFRSWLVAFTHRRMVATRRPPREAQPDGVLTTLLPTSARAVTIDSKALEQLAAEDLVALLDVLKEAQRDVLLLRLFGGLSISEVGAAIGRRPSAVRALQRGALQRLREALNNSGPQSREPGEDG